MNDRHRTSPYQDQLRLEAARNTDEPIDEYVARLRGMVAAQHPGAVATLQQLEKTFAFKMWEQSQRKGKPTLKVV